MMRRIAPVLAVGVLVVGAAVVVLLALDSPTPPPSDSAHRLREPGGRRRPHVALDRDQWLHVSRGRHTHRAAAR